MSQLLTTHQIWNQIFQSVSESESIFLTPDRMWIEILQCINFWRDIFWGKSKFFEKFALKKSVSLGHLTLWKQQNWHFSAFSQTLILIIFCEKRYIFSIKFSEQLRIFDRVFQNMLDFGPKFFCEKKAFFASKTSKN